jgi:hypothetical protein
MNTHSYTTEFVVEQSPEAAFAAIQNVRGWWSAVIEGDTQRVGDVFDYRYADLHRSTQTLVELVPGQKIVWQVSNSFLEFTADSREWEGSRLCFEVAKKGERTEVRFTHDGLVREHECFDKCTDAWGFYIRESLHALITTGRGDPYRGE